MNARDELAQVIATELDTIFGNRIAEPAQQDVKLATALIAAGYRKPRTITTEQDSDALPIGAVVLDCNGDVARRFPGGWRTTVVEPDGTAWLSGHMEDAELPATVLHEGAAA